MYLYLLLFVDIDIYQDLVLVVGIILLRDDDVGILETLIVKVALNQCLGAVYQVGVIWFPLIRPTRASKSSRSDFFTP